MPALSLPGAPGRLPGGELSAPGTQVPSPVGAKSLWPTLTDPRPRNVVGQRSAMGQVYTHHRDMRHCRGSQWAQRCPHFFNCFWASPSGAGHRFPYHRRERILSRRGMLLRMSGNGKPPLRQWRRNGGSKCGVPISRWYSSTTDPLCQGRML